MKLSPQIGTQEDLVVGPPPEHNHFGSFPEQFGKQIWTPRGGEWLYGPSSHVSGDVICPSPQTAIIEQTSVGAPLHVQPAKAPIQFDWQPGAAPASQVSFPTLNPSPHLGEHEVQVVGFPPEQVHLGSAPKQVERHPVTNKGAIWVYGPSSQVSGDMTLPSPHIGVQVEFPP